MTRIGRKSVTACTGPFVGLLLVRLQIKATETRSSMVRLAHLVGPAFMLINYQLFIRLHLFQMSIKVRSLLVGARLAIFCVRQS
ncbi:hypothetical protein AB1484_18975 [Parafrankia sp. FMc6]|uniref:hypothetical protein n=1 Tax=Parafrankia soli TaxID=2599596 RepID=UPI0034D6ABDD